MEKLAAAFAVTLGKYVSKEAVVFIISMIPILELRGGLIVSKLLEVPITTAIPLCIIGNIIPIPFILLFIKQIFKWMKKIRLFRGLVEKLENKAAVDAFIDRVNVLQPRLAKEGITLHYHNHDHEFKPNEDGLIPEEEILSRTSINLEVDTYWVFAADKDPVAFLKEHKDRISVIHLKDGIGGHEGKSLGLGKAPVLQVRETAIALGMEMVVESEGLEPTGLEEVKRCIDFLKEVDAKI